MMLYPQTLELEILRHLETCYSGCMDGCTGNTSEESGFGSFSEICFKIQAKKGGTRGWSYKQLPGGKPEE